MDVNQEQVWAPELADIMEVKGYERWADASASGPAANPFRDPFGDFLT